MFKKFLVLSGIFSFFSFQLIKSADHANSASVDGKRLDCDQLRLMTQSGVVQECFPELASFYVERLKSKGIDTSSAQVTKILNDLKRAQFRLGRDVGELMNRWDGDFAKDKQLGAPESDLFLSLELCCNELNSHSKRILGLSSEQVFRFEAEKSLKGFSQGMHEELYAFVWDKLKSRHDSANFAQSLDREAECFKKQVMSNLPANIKFAEYPLFEQLLNIYTTVFQLCSMANCDGYSSDFPSELLPILKRIEQKEPRFAQLELRDVSSVRSIELFAQHEDVCALTNAMKNELAVVKDKRFQDLKSFVAQELEFENVLEKKCSLTPQLKNRIRNVMINSKGDVNEKLFEETLNVVLGLYNNNEQTLSSALTPDIKLYNKMMFAVQNLKERNDTELYSKLLKEGLVEHGSNGTSLLLSRAGAPLLTKLGIIYDSLFFLLETLRDKGIVSDEDSFLSIYRFYQKEKGKNFLDAKSKEAGSVLLRKLVADIISVCPENTAATFVQVRKEHARKMKERAELELASKQEQENAFALLAQEKANNRRMAKEKKRQEQETLKSVFLGWLGYIKDMHTAADEQIQSAKKLFYCELQEPNKKHADLVEAIREHRKSLPVVEEGAPKDSYVVTEEASDVQDAQLQVQKELTRQAKIARRVERKKIKDAQEKIQRAQEALQAARLKEIRDALAVFEVPRLEEKSNRYRVSLFGCIAETKRQADVCVLQQQQFAQEQLEQEQAALRLQQQQAELERAASEGVSVLQQTNVRQNNPYGQQVLPVNLSLLDVETQSEPLASVVRQNNPYKFRVIAPAGLPSYGYDLALYRSIRNHRE